jgi:cell division protein FtsA
MKPRRRVECALDVGSTRVLALIAEIVEQDVIRVLGAGEAPSGGMSRGLPADLERTIAGIEAAVEAAEHGAGLAVDGVHLGLSGAAIVSENRRGACVVTRNPRDPRSSLIQQGHIERVQAMALREDALPLDRVVLHALPQEYIVDGVGGVVNAAGMNGLSLECRLHCITAPLTVVDNLKRCVHRAGLEVQSLTLGSLAAATLLKRDERELGAMLLEIGAGSTDLAIFVEGQLRHAASVPLGGAAISRDITLAFRTPHEESERLKRSHGCCLARLIRREERFAIEALGAGEPLQASRSQLCQVIQPRVEEILEQVEAELEASGLRWLLGAGVVITGGAAQLEGLPELVSERFGLPVRLGRPAGVIGLADTRDPAIWAVAVGLARRALTESAPRREVGLLGRLGGWLGRARRQVAM